MRKLLVTSSAAMVIVGMVALGAGPAWAAKNGTHRPWTQFSITPTTLNIVTGEVSGGGESLIVSHLGRCSTDLMFTSETTAVATLTASNGDEIFESLTNISYSPGTGGDLIATEDVAVTGGTGRFTGATGEGEATTVLTPTGTPNVYEFTSTLHGWISY